MSIDDYELSAHDGQPQRLFLFTMGETVFAYTNAPRPHTYNDITYSPLLVRMEDLTQALSEDSPTIRVEVDAKSSVAAQFIPYMPIIPVKLRVYRYHAGEDAYVTELIGEVANGSINAETDLCVLTVRLLASQLDRKVPWPVFQKPCNHVLYGPGCRVNRDLYKVEAVLSDVAGVVLRSPDFVHEEDPTYFVAGYMVRVATGEMRWIIAQDGDALTLQTPFLGIQEGEDVLAYAGCDLLKSTCKNKFNNLPRRWGFDHIPSKNPFADNVFGTGSSRSTGTGGLDAARDAALRQFTRGKE